MEGGLEREREMNSGGSGEDSAQGKESEGDRKRGSKCTHHDPGEQTDSFATVGVRNHVSVADGQESDGDKPHGAQEVAGHILGIVIPGREQRPYPEDGISQQAPILLEEASVKSLLCRSITLAMR
ncbi:hypothetical protein EYF80_016866 [Liparis tanakae]|uniref:Uncharacterized protein n=1 Tax=Liparis tanakae TaxID=230148 RepID=A0A4Z2I4K6_9TELE|nr:hypothetical protein EYF80_016866 [Liparis tanakae]